MTEFLEGMGFKSRPADSSGVGKEALRAKKLWLGKGNPQLEVVTFETGSQLSDSMIHEALRQRRGGRSAAILGVFLVQDSVVLCGPTGERPPIIRPSDAKQAERLCAAALSQPNKHGAIRFLSHAMPTLETELAGIMNEGLLSSHELTHGVQKRSDWEDACQAAGNALKDNEGGDGLLKGLGFGMKSLDNLTLLLQTNEERAALAVMLREEETPESECERFNSLSPLSYAMNKAEKEDLPWVVMVQKDRIRLYATKGIGVGRRSRTEAFVECQPPLLSEKNQGLLWLLFSAKALARQGTLEEILEESRRFAADLAHKLRARIYEIVVPELALGISEARGLKSPSKEELDLTYEMALTVLFRLLFIAYAEDRDLLPYRSNDSYRQRSLKRKAQELAIQLEKNTPVSKGTHHWDEACVLWEAVSVGKKEWGVPAYNGGLFLSKGDTDKGRKTAGEEIGKIKIENRRFGKALGGLLLIEGEDGSYPLVDFRSLGVREFGTVYEGLLETELSIADQDLALDKEGSYVPVRKGQEIAVKQGDIYWHGRSGSRKQSGSYYTPRILVDHLLEGALDPALKRHFDDLQKIGGGGEHSRGVFQLQGGGYRHGLRALLGRCNRPHRGAHGQGTGRASPPQCTQGTC